MTAYAAFLDTVFVVTIHNFSMVGMLTFVLMWIEGKCSYRGLVAALILIVAISNAAIVEGMIHLL